MSIPFGYNTDRELGHFVLVKHYYTYPLHLALELLVFTNPRELLNWFDYMNMLKIILNDLKILYYPVIDVRNQWQILGYVKNPNKMYR